MRALCLIALLLVVCPLSVPAATITVPDQFSSIQDAVYSAKSGDTVFIRAGVYYETSISIGLINETLSPRKAITIMGEGIGKTIIDGGEGEYDIIVVNAPYTIVKDLTLQNGKNAGVCFRGKGVFSIMSNCESRANQMGVRSSIYVRYDKLLNQVVAKPLVIGNRLVDNRYYGIYLENGCEAEVMHNWIEGNGFAAVYCRRDFEEGQCVPLIRNNYILNNSANSEVYGIVIAGGAEPIIRNNIIRGFPVGVNWYSTGGSSLFVNNIITECGIALYNDSSTSSARVDYCDLWQNSQNFQGRISQGGHLLIDEDPLFVDPDNNDYHLDTGSPCIDVGQPALPGSEDETDYDGSDIDIGLFGGKEVGPVCKLILSEASGEDDGLLEYFVAEEYEDLNDNGVWDKGEPFQDLDDSGTRDEGEPFTDENHNGNWDTGEPFTDENRDGNHQPNEPYEDLNENGRWDPQREPYDDANRNNRYDRGDLLTIIGLFSCFGYELENTDIYLATIFENGDIGTFAPDGSLISGITPQRSTWIGENFSYVYHAASVRFLWGFGFIDHPIGLYLGMGPMDGLHLPWDALTGQMVVFVNPD
ncbi:right-handed parallel beta-helix repeat-containing protein [bacterium]|nr:right-handed parallel beta-helix repeat-containing protein [bacterium]